MGPNPKHIPLTMIKRGVHSYGLLSSVSNTTAIDLHTDERLQKRSIQAILHPDYQLYTPVHDILDYQLFNIIIQRYSLYNIYTPCRPLDFYLILHHNKTISIYKKLKKQKEMKLRKSVLLALWAFILSSCATENGVFTEPISMYEKIGGTWNLSRIKQVDELAVANKSGVTEIDLTDFFETFSISLNETSSYKPTTFTTSGAPELPISGRIIIMN